MAYATTVSEVGPDAPAFLAENMAITFGGNAPAELRLFCYLLEPAQLEGSLALGQRVLIGEQTWTITAIGAVAEANLSKLGHVTLVFDGASEPRLPGALHVAGPDEAPALAEGVRVVIGDDQ